MGETDDFEWVDAKDAINREKHGLPLVLGRRLFDGRPRLDRPSRKSTFEDFRFETIAYYQGTVLLCVWTWNGRRRRAISLRPAEKRERDAYEKATRRGR
jgi:uncharacterized protein